MKELFLFHNERVDLILQPWDSRVQNDASKGGVDTGCYTLGKFSLPHSSTPV